MTIHIEDLTIDVIIGLLDFEREKPQRVIIDLEIDYTYTEQAFINYAHVSEKIQDNLKTNRYLLLEEALEGVSTCLLDEYPQIEKLRLKISKPDILKECRVALSATY